MFIYFKSRLISCYSFSLYPYVCKYGKFVLQHPRIITENFLDLSAHPYEGVIKAVVLPPRKLLFPVLPARINKKLVFTLCSSCAVTLQQTECKHTTDERKLIGTWITEELYAAISRGYKVLEIHEIWHYEQVAQYNTVMKSGGLFAEYINKFLKLKQEADGWPAAVVSNAQKEDYISQYYQHEGIKLDKNKIQKNPGFRSLAKLMLNCKRQNILL